MSRFVQSLNSDSALREKDDYYPTEVPMARAIVALEAWPARVWEPACGCGVISRAFADAGHDIVSTDLVDRGFGESRQDFLMERRLLAPGIVTNPPFKLAGEFTSHALALGADKVAMLLRLAWLSGCSAKRSLIIDKSGLARVHVSSRRTSMKRGGTDAGAGGGGMIDFAWFVWERGHAGPVTLSRFDWKDWA